VGNFRQHLSAATATGVAYAVGAKMLCGVHWMYGAMAALLASIGGLLPDIDHPMGIEIKSVATLFGTAGALVAWRKLHLAGLHLPIELQIWSVIACYFMLRIGTRSLVSRMMVHRGMCHSVPTCVLWGALTYLAYPSPHHSVRVWMAGAIMAGFMSHLILDEIFSVDLRGTRLKRSFGTAIKFWAPSMFSTIAVYGALYLVLRGVLTEWPAGPFLATLNEPVPEPDLPRWPSDWPQPEEWVRRLLSPSARAEGSALPAAIGGAAAPRP
jgi:hypothetical protein